MSYLTPSISPIHSLAEMSEEIFLIESSSLPTHELHLETEDSMEKYPFFLKGLSTAELQNELKHLRETALRVTVQIEAVEEELEVRALPLEERLKLLGYPELEAILDEKLELRKTLEEEEKDAVEDWIIAALVELRRRRGNGGR
jgi:hypothetical protein